MKKRIASFSMGFAATLLLLAACGTALAASGKVSYNFANVALNGETKITAGQDITAANGQRVPGTILFTDAAGGKTNYLPIRAVSELLGVEIGYDPAARTILLGGQPAQTAASAAIQGRLWRRELDSHGGVHYQGPGKAAAPVRSFPWHITWLPEGWTLDTANARAEDFAVGELSYPVSNWYFRNGEAVMEFHCYPRSDGYVDEWLGPNTDSAKALRTAAVQGRGADFYQGDDKAVLVWEDAGGTLFWLDGPLDQAALERIAASVVSTVEEPMPSYQAAWLPDENARLMQEVMPGIVISSWSANHLYLTYSSQPLTAPAGTPETVTVNGVKAAFWAGDPNAEGPHGASYSEKQRSVLLWTDSKAGVTFRIQGVLDKDTMIRMAESIAAQ